MSTSRSPSYAQVLSGRASDEKQLVVTGDVPNVGSMTAFMDVVRDATSNIAKTHTKSPPSNIAIFDEIIIDGIRYSVLLRPVDPGHASKPLASKLNEVVKPEGAPAGTKESSAAKPVATNKPGPPIEVESRRQRKARRKENESMSKKPRAGDSEAEAVKKTEGAPTGTKEPSAAKPMATNEPQSQEPQAATSTSNESTSNKPRKSRTGNSDAEAVKKTEGASAGTKEPSAAKPMATNEPQSQEPQAATSTSNESMSKKPRHSRAGDSDAEAEKKPESASAGTKEPSAAKPTATNEPGSLIELESKRQRRARRKEKESMSKKPRHSRAGDSDAEAEKKPESASAGTKEPSAAKPMATNEPGSQEPQPATSTLARTNVRPEDAVNAARPKDTIDLTEAQLEARRSDLASTVRSTASISPDRRDDAVEIDNGPQHENSRSVTPKPQEEAQSCFLSSGDACLPLDPEHTQEVDVEDPDVWEEEEVDVVETHDGNAQTPEAKLQTNGKSATQLKTPEARPDFFRADLELNVECQRSLPDMLGRYVVDNNKNIGFIAAVDFHNPDKRVMMVTLQEILTSNNSTEYCEDSRIVEDWEINKYRKVSFKSPEGAAAAFYSKLGTDEQRAARKFVFTDEYVRTCSEKLNNDAIRKSVASQPLAGGARAYDLHKFVMWDCRPVSW